MKIKINKYTISIEKEVEQPIKSTVSGGVHLRPLQPTRGFTL